MLLQYIKKAIWFLFFLFDAEQTYDELPYIRYFLLLRAWCYTCTSYILYVVYTQGSVAIIDIDNVSLLLYYYLVRIYIL